MPWRHTDDEGRRNAYHVWVSEVMLQQTRVDAVIPYFERFAAAFPDISALADASVDEVLKRWEGLGYYSRARNLHAAAQELSSSFSGQIPADPVAFRALPGVGPYTTAAVMSLAFGLPLAALDGNVVRVLARVFAVDDDARSSRTRNALQSVANALVPHTNPGAFNEALMELGATVCTPKSPGCEGCPLAAVCAAHASGAEDAYPVMIPKKAVPHKTIAVGLIADDEGRLLVQRRPEGGMLGGLWEFPGGKQESDESLEATCQRELREELGVDVAVGPLAATVDHAYSHFKVTIHAYMCSLLEGTPVSTVGEPVRWASADELDELAIPRATRMILENLGDRQRS